MTRRAWNRSSGLVMIVLSLVALGTVASGYVHRQPPAADEGTAAHLFQLAIVALAPVGVLFLATADWAARPRPVRPLLIAGTALVLAFVGLFFLEH